jgi:4a-hydroxytetrahydrobiopterin dehydratase
MISDVTVRDAGPKGLGVFALRDFVPGEFTLADHIEAMGFVNRAALAAEKMDHHPELTIVYNRVSISLSTHDAGGVTQKDIDLAHAIERYA